MRSLEKMAKNYIKRFEDWMSTISNGPVIKEGPFSERRQEYLDAILQMNMPWTVISIHDKGVYSDHLPSRRQKRQESSKIEESLERDLQELTGRGLSEIPFYATLRKKSELNHLTLEYDGGQGEDEFNCRAFVTDKPQPFAFLAG